MVKYGPLNPQAFAHRDRFHPTSQSSCPRIPANLPAQLAESDRWWAGEFRVGERAFDDMRSLGEVRHAAPD